MMSLLLRTAAFLIIAPGTIIVGVPALIIWLTGGSMANPAVAAIGWLIFAIGLAISAWCVLDFVTVGRGTPDPNRPPTRLVVQGLFQIVRNPMYLGGVIAIVGEAILFLSPLLLVWAGFVLLGFHLRVIMYEEPTLAHAFGTDWKDYQARVPRWFPRLTSR